MRIRWTTGRFLTLLRKEGCQIQRDLSVIVMGLGLPLLMLFIYGWGISMDVRGIPVAVVVESESPLACRIATDFAASEWFDATVTRTRREAEALFEARRVELIVELSADFDAERAGGATPAAVNLTAYAVDSNSAQLFRKYAMSLIQGAIADESGQAGMETTSNAGSITIVSRTWFNEADASAWYIVPGILVVVIGIAGALMGAGGIARECERGTYASLLTSAASPVESLFAKFIPYFVIAWTGFAVAWVLAMTVFGVPLRGSILLLVVESLCFAAWSVMLGLFLSARFKNQFLATEFAVILSFLPTLMLSGLLFDLRSVPAAIEVLGRLWPPAYAVEAFKICFLSGGSTRIVMLDIGVTILWALLFGALALRAMKKGG